jgi:hypothetical protein
VAVICEEHAMNIHEGDRVLVNVAPFIASTRRQNSAVACRVLRVDEGRVLVSTLAPARQFDLWVNDCWVDRVVERPREVVASN